MRAADYQGRTAAAGEEGECGEEIGGDMAGERRRLGIMTQRSAQQRRQPEQAEPAQPQQDPRTQAPMPVHRQSRGSSIVLS